MGVIGDDAVATRVALERFFRGRVIIDDVEDLVQQTIVRAMETQRSSVDVRFARAYLFAIARRVLFAHFASRSQVSHCEEGDEPEHLDASSIDAERDVLTRLSVSYLPAELREVVRLSYWAGMSRSEVAQWLGLPMGTVASRLRRGLSLLRTGGAEGGSDEGS